ncbi:YczE/YyaS/YitT family protein [Oceanobacillus sojae]|uniref:YczE/YyaS/YitT family protein n=1 Tax=Oceanobacillus sojae TaxID=582851 RepID=UPI00098894FF|nr:YitT family protein [Oceanobacillus sojae]
MAKSFRWLFFLLGLLVFSGGISLAINMQHLGVHPWDVLNVAMFDKIGFTVGTWNIVISFLLIGVCLILDRRYIKIGTFFNAILVGSFVDIYHWTGILPTATNTWLDIIFMLTGICIMGFGGGMYNAAGVGSGPRDGFMLSLADKLGAPIGRVRIITECCVLVLGLIIGGPVFIFTFVFTFIQSPIFQATYLKLGDFVLKMEYRQNANRKKKHIS